MDQASMRLWRDIVGGRVRHTSDVELGVRDGEERWKDGGGEGSEEARFGTLTQVRH